MILSYNRFVCQIGEFVFLSLDNQICGLILPDFETKKISSIRNTLIFKHLERHLGNIVLKKKNEIIFEIAQKALYEYFFLKHLPKTPFLLIGTPFQKKVWQNIKKVPFGQTITYQELAMRSGCPQGQRAVAQACKANPLPIFIPCHRIVGKKGFQGYAAGLGWKLFLLKHESVK